MLDATRIGQMVMDYCQRWWNEHFVDQPYKTTIDPAYSGGNPKTDDISTGTATDATHVVLAPYAWTNVRASKAALKVPYGGAELLLGEIISLPAGKLTTGGYWIVPSPYPTTETTFTFAANAALRLFCPIPLRITRIVIEVTTAVAASNLVVNLYSGDGVELIATSGNISAATTGRKTATISAVNITPGVYVVEVTSTDTGVAARATASSAAFAAFSNEVVVTRAASHTMSSGVSTAAFPWVQFAEV